MTKSNTRFAVGSLLFLSVLHLLFPPSIMRLRWSSDTKDPLRIAFLISGPLRSLVREDMRKQQRRALFDPLVGAHVDIFMNLDLDHLSQNFTAISALKQSLKPKRLLVKSYSCKEGCERSGCLSNAITTSRMYEQFARVRDTMLSIKAEEDATGRKYDFIVRVRPDLEFYESLPRLKCWEKLPDFIIWDLDARYSDTSDRPTTTHIVPAFDVKFLGDWFTIVPRKLATAFFTHPLEQILDCVPLEPSKAYPFKCGTKDEFWRFPECRFLVSAQRVNAHVGKLMLENASGTYTPHTIVRCDDDMCRATYRMNGPRFCGDRKCHYSTVKEEPLGSRLTIREQCFHGFASSLE